MDNRSGVIILLRWAARGIPNILCVLHVDVPFQMPVLTCTRGRPTTLYAMLTMLFPGVLTVVSRFWVNTSWILGEHSTASSTCRSILLVPTVVAWCRRVNGSNLPQVALRPFVALFAGPALLRLSPRLNLCLHM